MISGTLINGELPNNIMEQYVGYKRNFYQNFENSKNCLLDVKFQFKLVSVVELY